MTIKETAVEPSRQDTRCRDQPRADNGSDVSTSQFGGVPASTGSEHPPSVGTVSASGGKAQGGKVRRGLQGPELRVSTPKPQSCLTVGEGISDVQQDQSASRLSTSNATAGKRDPGHHRDDQSDGDQA